MADDDAPAQQPQQTFQRNESGACPCCASWQAADERDVHSVSARSQSRTNASTAGEGGGRPRRPRHHGEQFGNFFVLRNANVFTLGSDDDDDGNEGETRDKLRPPFLLDIWIGGGKVIAMTPPAGSSASSCMCPTIPNLHEIDATGMHVVPGFVDVHVHCSGGGGEAGFGSRIREATRDDLIDAGVTTFVATLGTDTVTRGMEDLIARARSLSSPPPSVASGDGGGGAEGGLTGLAWLGGYSFPVENAVTGSVRRDVTLLPEVIGVGELALSDHRGSHPSADELTRLASEVRVAGMLSGKAGVTYCHMGEEPLALRPLRDAVERNPVLVRHLIPTHVERSSALVEEGMEWMRRGGSIDFAGWPERQRVAIQRYIKDPEVRALIRDRLSISSDSYGSINEFDEHGNLIAYKYGLPTTLLGTFLALVYEDGVEIETALRFFCRNPASNVIRMDGPPAHKGSILVGGDADLLVLKLPPQPLPSDYPRTNRFGMDWPSMEGVLQYVIARGCVLKHPT